MRTAKLTPLLLFLVMTGAAACGIVNSGDLGDPELTPSATTVSIDEEVTITLSGVNSGGHGPTPSFTWSKKNGPEFTKISGGGARDETWTIRFHDTGTATIKCKVEVCMHGTCQSETAETTITVE
jgi:hypothetical protein